MCWNRFNLSIPDACFMCLFSLSLWVRFMDRAMMSLANLCVNNNSVYMEVNLFSGFYSLYTINVHLHRLLLDPSITISKCAIFSLTIHKAVLWMTCKCFFFFFLWVKFRKWRSEWVSSSLAHLIKTLISLNLPLIMALICCSSQIWRVGRRVEKKQKRICLQCTLFICLTNPTEHTLVRGCVWYDDAVVYFAI